MVLNRKLNLIILFPFILLMNVQTLAISAAALDKKLDKIIKKDLGLNEFEKVAADVTSEELEKAGIELFSHQLFKLNSKNVSEGFYIVQTAMGRFHDFTYVVFFGKDLEIKLVRVVEYSEEHGVEITHKRWLRQFIGKTSEDNLIFKKNIDAISGATISGKSITESINQMLQNVKLLNEHNLL